MKRDFQLLQLGYEKNLLNTQLEIQEQTFRNIAQEIHDNISLSLTLAKLHLNTFAMQREGDRQPLVDSSVDLISKALADLNDISKSLDSDLIKSNGLIHALKYETDIISRSGQLQIDIQLTGEPRYMDADRELVIFRIIQEAFNNIVKHAAASRVILRLDYAPGGLHLSIQDNGRGFDAAGREQRNEGRRGAGLKNIKNRAHMLQAILGISSGPGEGTTINLDIPYDSNLTDAKRSN